jgi:hypothetical protein
MNLYRMYPKVPAAGTSMEDLLGEEPRKQRRKRLQKIHLQIRGGGAHLTSGARGRAACRAVAEVEIPPPGAKNRDALEFDTLRANL